jgi:hypothetical protein
MDGTPGTAYVAWYLAQTVLGPGTVHMSTNQLGKHLLAATQRRLFEIDRKALRCEHKTDIRRSTKLS